MAIIDDLLENNRCMARHEEPNRLPLRPSAQLAIVTCMDSRIDVFRALGLRDGQAHVLRNAGGVITDDMVRSLAISQRLLETRHIMVIHHTDCGMEKLTDDGFRAELQAHTGVAPAFAIESFTDVEADVRQSLQRLQDTRFLLYRDDIRGFVYDVNTHELREISD
jgi:carbonic anhydrase